MKFKAPWLENNQEVDLPEMKVEGSLAVAELTKKHADEFLPFILAIQEEATIRARINSLGPVLDDDPTVEQLNLAKAVLQIYDVEFEDDNIKAKAKELLGKLSTELADASKKAAQASIASTPFFLKRSLLEAFYMIKAFYWQKAREKGEKPKMPFSHSDLEELMDDPELALFSKHSTDKLKKEAVEEIEPEVNNAEELKKK